MKTSDKLKKYPKKFWLIPLVIFIIPIVGEFFIRDIVYQLIYEFLNYSTLNVFYMLLCVLVYNFLNVYKSFILVLSVYFSNFLSTFLCFIYHVPRPYMVNELIVPYFKITD